MYYVANIIGDVILENGKKKDGTSFEYVSAPIEVQLAPFAPKNKMKYRTFREADSYLFDLLDGVAPASTSERDGKTIKVYTIDQLKAIDGALALHTDKDYGGISFRIRVCMYDLDGKYYIMRGGKYQVDEKGRRKFAEFWTTTTRCFAFTAEMESLANPFKAQWMSNVPEERIIQQVLKQDLEPERKHIVADSTSEMSVDDLLA